MKWLVLIALSLVGLVCVIGLYGLAMLMYWMLG